MATIGEKIISFYRELDYNGPLAPGVSVMNPYKNNPEVMKAVEAFYGKFYGDNNPRFIILGINPGRYGAGVTGITFTDTVRLSEKCGITLMDVESRELSSEFIYDMIDEFGGTGKFYSVFYLSAVCPLGFTLTGRGNKEINYNYYDNKKLLDAVGGFIVESIEKQLSFGIKREVCFCLGTGKNFRYLSELNKKHNYFEKIVPLEHPRFIMQYRRKSTDHFINKYIRSFSGS